MKVVLQRAMLLAGFGLAIGLTGQTARAADLFAPGPGADAPYDDPRYAYLYGRDGAAPPPGWAKRPPSPPAYYERLAPPPARRARRHWRRGHCTPRQVVRARLNALGWFGFKRAVILDRSYVEVDARHENGGHYRLTLDRCNGLVADTRLLKAKHRYARPDTGRYNDWRGRKNAWPVRPYARPYAWRWRRDRWRDDWD